MKFPSGLIYPVLLEDPQIRPLLLYHLSVLTPDVLPNSTPDSPDSHPCRRWTVSIPVDKVEEGEPRRGPEGRNILYHGRKVDPPDRTFRLDVSVPYLHPYVPCTTTPSPPSPL